MNGTVHILIYHIGEQGYGLFLSDVERTVRAVAITPVVDAPENILGFINFQGRVIPVMNMRKKLRLTERDVNLGDQFIIARTARHTVALVVDSVEGVIERSKAEVITDEKIVPGLENLKGVLKLQDGLILIHDLDRFFFQEEGENLDAALGDT